MNLRDIASLVRVARPPAPYEARRLARCYSIDDLARAARRRLPAAAIGYLDGGGEDECTLRRNRAAFDELELVPRVLRDVSHVDTATTVLGTPMPVPFALALHAGVTLPSPRLTMATLFDGVRHPSWSWRFLTTERIDFPNITSGTRGAPELESMFDGTFTWDDLDWIANAWHGPIALKGVLAADDARRAADTGVDAVIVDILTDELRTAMALSGCADVDDISADVVQRAHADGPPVLSFNPAVFGKRRRGTMS